MNDAGIAAMRGAIWFLLLLYSAPFFAVTYSYFATDGFSRSSGVFPFFASLAYNQDHSLALVHRALLPLMGGFAPIAFRDRKTARSAVWLMLLLLFAIAISIFLSTAFGENSTQQNLKELDLFPGMSDASSSKPEAFQAGLRLVQSLLNRSQEVMGMYLLMLFGLQLAR